MSKFKMAVSDLDGTLLDDDHQLSAYTKEAITRLVKHKVPITLATGRHYVDTKAIREILGLNSFLITSNGAMVHNADDELIICHQIEQEIAHKVLYEFDLPKGVCVNIYTKTQWLATQLDESLADYYDDSGFQYQLVGLEDVRDVDFIKIYFACHDLSKLAQIEKWIADTIADRVSYTYAMPFCLEIMAKNVNKGVALQQAAQSVGLSMDELVAFGDGQNDYEMLTAVGKGYIMSNATDQLRNMLPNFEELGYNHEHAVAKFLEREFLATSSLKA